MKKTIFAVLAGAALIATGCVNTISDTSSFAITPMGKDTLSNRYQRSVDQVYQASVAVINNNGALVTEYIPHGTNTVRSLMGRVQDNKVWMRVSFVDARTSQVDVEARTKWGTSNLDLAHELGTEISLQLTR